MITRIIKEWIILPIVVIESLPLETVLVLSEQNSERSQCRGRVGKRPCVVPSHHSNSLMLSGVSNLCYLYLCLKTKPEKTGNSPTENLQYIYTS